MDRRNELIEELTRLLECSGYRIRVFEEKGVRIGEIYREEYVPTTYYSVSFFVSLTTQGTTEDCYMALSREWESLSESWRDNKVQRSSMAALSSYPGFSLAKDHPIVVVIPETKPSIELPPIGDNVHISWHGNRQIPQGINPLSFILAEAKSLIWMSPFKSKLAVYGEMFEGREDVLDKLRHNGKKCYAVSGPRLAGKSSLMQEHIRRFATLLAKNHTPRDELQNRARLITLQGLRGLGASPAEKILATLFEMGGLQMKKRFELLWKKEEGHDEPGGLRVSDVWRDRFGTAAGASLRELEKRFQSNFREKSMLLLIDEFDELLNSDGDPYDYECAGVLNLLRGFFDSVSISVNFQIVIAGSPTIYKWMGKQGSAGRNFFSRLPLVTFTAGESKRLVKRGFSSVGIDVDEESLERIHNESGGMPFIIQFICETIVDLVRRMVRLAGEQPWGETHVSKSQLARVNRDIVNEAINGFEVASEAINHILRNCDSADTEILKTLVRQPRAVDGTELAIQLAKEGKGKSDGTLISIHDSIEKLRQMGLIHDETRSRFSVRSGLIKRIYRYEKGKG